MSDAELLECSKFVYKNHPKIKENMPYWVILSFLDIFKNRIIIQKENDCIKGMAMYMKINDDNLDYVLNKDSDSYTFAELSDRLKEEGNNIHFVGLVSSGIKYIRNGIRDIIKKENPATISWFKDYKGGRKMFCTIVRS